MKMACDEPVEETRNGAVFLGAPDEGVQCGMDAIGYMQFIAASLIAQCALLRAQRKMRDKSMPSMLLTVLL